MKKEHRFLAIDLGATSGRTIVGTLNEGRLKMDELTRFDNQLVSRDGHVYWDFQALWGKIVEALQTVAREHIDIESIGIDTWGCDFLCLGADGTVIEQPLAYRDPHTLHTMERYFAQAMKADKVYEKTGIQFMNFNSLFQLYAMREAGNKALSQADKIAFIPDALIHQLTGTTVCEYTVASTSQMINPYTRQLDEELLATVGLKRSNFGPVVMPGTHVGTLKDELCRLTGLRPVDVIAVASHDTASAVAAVPALSQHFAYLSSGTWSLMGIESRHPIISQRSLELNFTNEGGIDGTTRFLKNICGMWLYERCREEWATDGKQPHEELIRQAEASPSFRSIINPDHPLFSNPTSMTEAIHTYCRLTSQPVPETKGQTTRCIFESLALRYRQVLDWLREFSAEPLDVLHIIGGGARNQLLNQFTANACNISVEAGPQEATAIGNIMMQAKSKGLVDDSQSMRTIIAKAYPTRHFSPENQAEWQEAYGRFLTIVNHLEPQTTTA